MKIRIHDAFIPGSMSAALASFEECFSYPLGAGARFRISHGEDYMAFFRAMGGAVAVLAEGEGCIDGCLLRVSRRISLDGGGPLPVHYLCDLKVRQDRRGGPVLAGLIRATEQGILTDGNTACYCVVMDGTGRLPTGYTGRLGVPRFVKVGEIVVLRLSLKSAPVPAGEPAGVREDEILMPGYRVTGGDSSLRSMMQPVDLRNEGASGILEDTRKAKRLFLESGEELVSAHVSAFAYATVDAGARLLTEAVMRAAAADVPAVFVAVPKGEMERLRPELVALQVLEAPASVFAHGLEEGHDWWIDTAEI